MADQRLQQLRRAWDEGDLDAQVRLLRERMRAGELSEERVRLAAHLGDVASLEVAGEALDPVTVSGGAIWSRRFRHYGPQTFCGWVMRLAAWGPGALARAVLTYDHVLGGWLGPAVPGQISPLVPESLRCPADGSRIDPRACRSCGFGSSIALGVAEAVVAGDMSERSVDALRDRCWVSAWRSQETRAAIREALIPWALGLCDPVAERVAAREVGSE